MNQHDRKQLEIAHLKLDDMRQDLVDLKNDMEKAHQKTDESLSFIKENLFNDSNTPFVPENLDYSALSKMHTNMQNLESHLIPKTAEQFYYRMIF